MKFLPLFLAGAACAAAQPFGAGIKAGIPLTDFIDAAQSGTIRYSTVLNRYVFGVEGELRLPFGLGVEIDALYRHMNFAVNGIATTSSAWEFPLLAKYRFKAPVARPFVDAGVAWDTLSGLTQAAQLKKNTVNGIVFGGGLDVHLLVIHITPEIRYTHWGSQHFDLSGLSSNQNQAEFLVGFTF
jgi:hypothetical protein